MAKKDLTKLFDRSFSTRARYQIAWLVSIIVVAFLFYGVTFIQLVIYSCWVLGH